MTEGPQLPWYAPFRTPDTVQGPSPDLVPPRSPLLTLLGAIVERGPVELADAAVLRDLVGRLTR